MAIFYNLRKIFGSSTPTRNGWQWFCSVKYLCQPFYRQDHPEKDNRFILKIELIKKNCNWNFALDMWLLFYNRRKYWEIKGPIFVSELILLKHFLDFYILCYYLPFIYCEKKLYQFSCSIPFFLFILLAIRYQPGIGRATYYNDPLFQKKKKCMNSTLLK